MRQIKLAYTPTTAFEAYSTGSSCALQSHMNSETESISPMVKTPQAPSRKQFQKPFEVRTPYLFFEEGLQCTCPHAQTLKH